MPTHGRCAIVTSELTTQVLISIRDEARAFRAEMNEFRAEVNERFERVEIRLDHVENRLDRVENRLDVVDQRLGIVESTMADLSSQVFMSTRILRKLVEDRDSQRESLEALAVRVGVLESKA